MQQLLEQDFFLLIQIEWSCVKAWVWESQNHITFLLFHGLVSGVFSLFNVKNKSSIPHPTGMQLRNCKRLLSFTRVQCCLRVHNNMVSAGTFTIFEKYKISIVLCWSLSLSLRQTDKTHRCYIQLFHTIHAVCWVSVQNSNCWFLLNLNCSSNSCCFFSLCSWSLSYNERGSYASSGHSEREEQIRKWDRMTEILNHQQFLAPSHKNLLKL